MIIKVPAFDVAPVRASAITRMNVWIESFMESVTGGIPATEKVSWPVKAIAARAVVNGNATGVQTAIIQAEADVTGEALADLAATIAAQADQWEIVASMVTGLRRKTRDAINAAPDSETIEAILTQAQTDAATLAASIGS